jgi:hypothetical protein
MPLSSTDTVFILTQVATARTALDTITAGLSAAPPPATTPIHVTAGQSLQTALDAAALSGQSILLDPGTYVGGVLRGRPAGAPVITIAPFGVPTLPLGTRITAPPAVTLAPVAGTNVNLGTDKGANGYTLDGLGFASPGINGQMIALDCGATTLADVPTAISILGCWLDGGNACKRGIQANGAHITIQDSRIFGVMKVGQDTQAIGAANGPGPFLIQNNYLSAGSETILFGGADPTIPGLIPSDIVIRGNYLTKDRAWLTTKGTVKNVLELKNAQRVLIENNILENAWVDEQTGWLVQFTVRNQSGGAPWSTVRDVEFRYNVCLHGVSGINLLGLDDDPVTGAVFPSVRMQNINLHHNLFYDLGNPAFGAGTKFALATNNGVISLTVSHNTFLGAVSEALSLALGKSNTPSTNLQVINNVFPEGAYGIMGGGSTGPGTASWAQGVDPTSVFDYNLMLGGGVRKIPYPGAHTVVTAPMAMTLPFVPPAFVASDGTPVGVLLADLLARIPELDITQ